MVKGSLLSLITLSTSVAARRAFPGLVAAYSSTSMSTRVGQLETPALVVDAKALEANLDLCRESLAAFPGVALRPHAKAHKCGPLGVMQVQRMGARGLCCQTVTEAEVMAHAGVDDILITNQCITPGKLRRVLALRGHEPALKHLGFLVDSPGQVELLAAALASEVDGGTDEAQTSSVPRLPVSLYVEVDAGQARCGVPPPPKSEAVLEVARAIIAAGEATRGQVAFGGIHCYHGFLQHVRDPGDRTKAVEEGPVRAAAASRDFLAAHGVEVPVITGGGTGTYLMECQAGVHNEVQPGSFAFMDGDYAANSGMLGFTQSLFVLTTVISKPSSGRAVCDAGTKAVDQLSGPPEVRSFHEDLSLSLPLTSGAVTYKCGGDEHGILLGEGVAGIQVGDLLLLRPSHCDPAVNLYDQVHLVRDGKVEATHPIAARGPGC